MNGKRCRALRTTPGVLASRPTKRAYMKARVAKSQCAKLPADTRSRKRSQPIAPTWPRTEDQHAQSRPVIVVHPRRQTDKAHHNDVIRRMDLDPSNTEARNWYGMHPKCELDALALRHPVEV